MAVSKLLTQMLGWQVVEFSDMNFDEMDTNLLFDFLKRRIGGFGLLEMMDQEDIKEYSKAKFELKTKSDWEDEVAFPEYASDPTVGSTDSGWDEAPPSSTDQISDFLFNKLDP